MCNKKILVFSSFCLLVLFGMMNTVRVSAEDKLMVLGGKTGWPQLSKMDGVATGKGKYGYDCIQLDTNSRKSNERTDLLIDFESIKQEDAVGNYTVTKDDILRTTRAVMGKGAGLSRGAGGLRLSGRKGSLFGSSGNTGSFTIEFWLSPSIAENGEIVFSWRSSRTVADYPLYQMISASFFNNHLEWNFTNVFSGYMANDGEVTLSSYRTIIPDVWCHHSISYDDETGLLEYRIDDKLEALKYITTNGKERGGSIYNPQLGVVADIDICPQYTGSIDDFRIQRSVTDMTNIDMQYDLYEKNGGRFVTEPILVSAGASLSKVVAVTTEPAQTAVCLYVRSGDNFFNWTDDEPTWVPVTSGKPIASVKGLYFQIAVDLFPDGGGRHTPSVTELDVYYSEVPLPLPPFTVNADSGDGEVTVSWSYSVDDTAGGYYLYYGERPGEYLGREALQGYSPVNVGNISSITLTGLKNGKIYYFAVASYSRLDNTIQGTLSKEVYARPLKR